MEPASPRASGVRIYRRLLQRSLRYWRLLVLAVVAMLVTAATEPAFAWMMKPLLDGSFVNKDPLVIKWVPALILLVFLVRGVSNFASTYLMAKVARNVVRELRQEMFDKLLRLPVSEFDATSSGQLLSKITYNAEQVRAASTQSITILVRDTAAVIGLLALMIYHSWELTLAMFVIAPVIGVLVTRVTRRFRKISRRIQGTMGEVTHVVEEMIEGHRVVKIFGGEDYESRQFSNVSHRHMNLQLKMVTTQAANVPIVEFLVAVALAAIIYVATMPDVLESLSVGIFMSFVTALLLLLQPMRRLLMVNAQLQKGIAAGESIFGLLDSADEPDEGGRSLERAQGRIEYRGVHFSYSPDKGEVLKDINLVIEPGQTVAFVGRSGSGKTTLVNLLPRFYALAQGQILLDGVDTREYRLRDLRSQIAYVGQHVTLFNDSIARNIAYGRLEDVPMERIVEAARAAHALEFIERLPEGFETMVGENGVLLSGGQRQRLAIARALLKDAPVLILDEATSALDTEAERHIQAAIDNLRRNRTTLVIAHRLSTVERADRIVVLRDGQIVESGTHAGLLAQGGQYANLYRLQFHEPPAESGVR